MYLIIFNLKIWFILNKKPFLPKKVLCHMKNTLVFCEIKLFELFMLSSRFLIWLIKSLNSYVKSFVFIKIINFPVWLISTEVYGATHVWQINLDPKWSQHANLEVPGLNKTLVWSWPLFEDHLWACPPWSLLSPPVLANQ